MIDVIDVPIKDTWAAMEELVAKGKIRSIGVSNFTREKIEELLKTFVGSFLGDDELTNVLPEPKSPLP